MSSNEVYRMTIQAETVISRQIRKALQPYAVIFRGNVGVFKTVDGRFIDMGLPKGFTDLFGFRKVDGKMLFIEVKTDRGRLRAEQKVFGDAMQNYPVLYGVARCVDDAINILFQDKPLQLISGTQQQFK
jgi:hypothetical protein